MWTSNFVSTYNVSTYNINPQFCLDIQCFCFNIQYQPPILSRHTISTQPTIYFSTYNVQLPICLNIQYQPPILSRHTILSISTYNLCLNIQYQLPIFLNIQYQHHPIFHLDIWTANSIIDSQPPILSPVYIQSRQPPICFNIQYFYPGRVGAGNVWQARLYTGA